MTVAPPVVQPSLGLMALMQGGDPGWGTQGENDGNPVRQEGKGATVAFHWCFHGTGSVHKQLKTRERLEMEKLAKDVEYYTVQETSCARPLSLTCCPFLDSYVFFV